MSSFSILNESKYLYILTISIAILCIIYILIVALLMPAIQYSSVKKELSKLCKDKNIPFEIKKCRENGANCIITINNKTYHCYILGIPSKCDLQINNKDAWYYFKNVKGGNYSYKPINSIVRFMNHNMQNKIVLLANKAQSIKKYINESEMIMVLPSTDVYGVKVLNKNQFDFLLGGSSNV